MKVINKIKINSFILKKKIREYSLFLFSLSSFVAIFIDTNDINPFLIFENSTYIESVLCKKILFLLLYIFLILIISIIFSIIFLLCKQKQVIIQNKLVIEYGDILNIKNKKEKIIVIPVNTTFELILDEKIDIATPLVSIKTIHGKFLKKYIKKENIDKIKSKIQKSLFNSGFNVIKTLNKERGNKLEYDIGATALIDINNINYFLLAISSFDLHNNAYSSKENIIAATVSLIKQYNMNGQGYDLYVPIYGSGLSRSDNIDEKEALNILISIFSLYAHSYKGLIHIIIYHNDMDKIPLLSK